MGQLIKLNTVFANTGLPVIIDRNIQAVEAEIRALPELRAFWDMGDPSAITVSDGRIVRVADKSASGNHLVADAATAPVLDHSVLGGASSAYFDGTASMVSEHDALKADWKKLTIVVFALKTEVTDPDNNILAVGKTNAYVSVYVGNLKISVNSANLALNPQGGVVGRPLSVVASTDFIGNRSTIRTENEHKTGSGLAQRRLRDEPLYIGKWSDGADEKKAGSWKGYIGHVMVFEDYVEDKQYISDLLLEYARRKYNTPAWE